MDPLLRFFGFFNERKGQRTFGVPTSAFGVLQMQRMELGKKAVPENELL